MFERIGKNAARTLLAATGAISLSACAVDSGSATVASISPTETGPTVTATSVRRHIPTPTHPLASFPAPPLTPAEPQPVIDLTNVGAVVWGAAQPEIIDTRAFAKQINASTDWKGQVRDVEEMLPGEPEVPH